jgi:hypothetical protein
MCERQLQQRCTVFVARVRHGTAARLIGSHGSCMDFVRVASMGCGRPRRHVCTCRRFVCHKHNGTIGRPQHAIVPRWDRMYAAHHGGMAGRPPHMGVPCLDLVHVTSVGHGRFGHMDTACILVCVCVTSIAAWPASRSTWLRQGGMHVCHPTRGHFWQAGYTNWSACVCLRAQHGVNTKRHATHAGWTPCMSLSTAPRPAGRHAWM